MNKQELAEVLYGISVNYGLTMSKDYVSFMCKMFAMNRITIEQVKAAALKIIYNKTKAYEKMPNYAEFAEYIQGNQEQIADIEINNVIQQVRSIGADGKPNIPIPMVNAINIRFGGWQNLCATLEDSKLQWFIRDLKEAYLIELAKDDRLMLPDKQEAGEILRMINHA